MTTIERASILITSTEAMADFHPAADETCYCGSNKIFSQCCGSTELNRAPPYGLFIFENYIDNDTTQDLVKYANTCNGQRLMVIDNEKSTPDNIIKVEDQRRITERVELGTWRKQINELVRNIYVDLAHKCFGSELDWFESPDLMRYHVGGFYIKHADSQNMDPETRRWKKVIDRDISMLIYLNSDFEGGELSFYKLNYQLKPKAGSVVLFPSDHRFLHQAETVKQGVRYAIVSWASVKGIEKIARKPPECAILVS